ncbi:hypothetical protein QQZ08_010598 [Neonectria magnoliae]|uniref:Uncharacterized protein n=1 Tax=Neonectria magnoliae TaxID=2732573 RepID=A0ABR1HG82_9HYPO
MSASSHYLDVDIDETMTAIVEWERHDATHYLTEPDYKTEDIMLKSRFRAKNPCTLFELRFLLKLKGLDTMSNVFIQIKPSPIVSFDFTFAAKAPVAAQEKLNCNTLLLLGFHLNETLNVLVPVAAKDLLPLTRVQLGKVLDALRMLSKVTSFSIYIESIKLPKAKLQAITDAVTLGRLKSFRYQERLKRMYHGTGAKVAGLSTRVEDAPPLYNETEPPLLIAPIDDKKRR